MKLIENKPRNEEEFNKLFSSQYKKPKFLGLAADWLVLIAVLLVIGTHFTTNIILQKHYSVAERLNITQSAVNIMESSPAARWAFNLGNIGMIGSLLIAPAMLIGVYWLVRKTSCIYTINFFAITIFFMFLFNALNDLSQYLGMFA